MMAVKLMAKIFQYTLSDEVLDKTMRLFWRKGFSGTSIDDITTMTGLNRAAIYNHFGGKEALFLAMLQRYRQQVTTQFVAPLQQEYKSIANIHHFFEQFLMMCKTSDTSDGCFLIAVASDLPSHSEPIADFIAAFLSLLRTLFYNNLLTAKTDRQIPDETNCYEVADFLVGNVFGIMTLFRAKAPKTLLINHLTGLLTYLSILSGKEPSCTIK